MRYDMLCRTTYSVDEVGSTVSWRDFCAFLKNLPPDSALYRETHQERAPWDAGYVDAHLIAALIDEVKALRYLFECVHSKQKPPTPKPFPRPWKKREVKAFDISAFREKLKKYEEM